ncbi:SusD family protein [compost metagenome]
MRAEAYFRKGQTALAVADINLLRTSRTREAYHNNAPGVAISTLDEAKLYKEIAFETYWEMYRRPQMIRFGKYEQAFSAKPVSQPTRRIFPIPQTTLDVSKDFVQNKGY